MTTPITIDQVEAAHWLLVGTTGSGKTYLGRGLFGELRRAGRRVAAIDLRAKLWGLTLGPEGTAKGGLDFIIFGGKRAVVPMTPDQGAELGQLLAERNIPAIFDLSQWKARDQERWVADFGTTLFNANETAMHLLIDEVQSLAPQGGGGEAYDAVRLLAEQGRGNGINLLLTAPRMAGLDANVRGAIAAMVAMRQTSDVDIKRTADLLAAHLTIDVKTFRAELPTLPTGTGFVWSPTGTGLERVSFPPNDTFDSSRTPRHGDTPPPPIALSSALVEELRAVLAPAAPAAGPAKAESQKSGKPEIDDRDVRIADLEAANALLKRTAEVVGVERDAIARRIAAAGAAVEAAVHELGAAIRRIFPDLDLQPDDAILHSHDASLQSGPDPAATTPPANGTTTPPQPKPRRAPSTTTDGLARLNQTALDAAALLKGIAPDAFAWNDVLLLLVRRPNSGDSRQAKRALLDHELIVASADGFSASPSLIGDEQYPIGAWPSDDELRKLWADKLRGPGGEILLDLAKHGPAGAVDVAKRLGKSASSGWWRQGVRDLRRSNIVADHDGKLTLNPFLAPGEE